MGFPSPPPTGRRRGPTTSIGEALRLLTRYNPDGSLVRAGTTLNLHPERIIQYFWQKGGSWFTPDGRRSAVNDEIGIATLEWLHEILHVDRSAITNSAGDGEFNTALTSVHVTGQWFRPADDISARVRPLPRDVGGPATPMFIDPYIVLATTNHPEEATRFLMFLISEDVAELFIQRRHIGVPMHRATVLNMLDSMFGNLPTEDKMVWIEAMDYTRRVPFTPNWTEIVQASTEELQNRFQAMSRKPEASGLRLFARKRPVKKKSAPRAERGAGEKVCRRRATLPPGFPGSTITAEGLNFRVRNGNGWVPLAMVTGNGERCVRFWLVPGGWHPDDCTVRMV